MLCVPSSLDELLLLFASCFSRPTFQTFRVMVVGQISQTSLRTVCGMLVGARLSGVWHHARAHRFFSLADWSVGELGLRVADLIVERLLAAGAPLVVPVDDTLAKRRGRKVFGAGWHHDATANSRKGSVAWGNNWTVVSYCTSCTGGLGLRGDVGGGGDALAALSLDARWKRDAQAAGAAATRAELPGRDPAVDHARRDMQALGDLRWGQVAVVQPRRGWDVVAAVDRAHGARVEAKAGAGTQASCLEF